jgi:GlpG protein
MRQIGIIADERYAGLFGDYLLAHGVPNVVEEGSTGWEVWVERDDDIDRARVELGQFASNPGDPRYVSVAERAGSVRKQEAKREVRLRRQHIDVRTGWGRLMQAPRPLTISLLILCVIVGFISQLGSDNKVLQYLWISSVHASKFENLSKWDGLAQIRQGEVWRLISPIFIHYGAMHLIFNMLWLVDLGSAIERRRGTFFLGALVFGSAVVSNLAQYWVAGPYAGGMSGVVYALFGYVWMKSRYQPQDGLGLQENTVFYMIAWLFLCMTGWIGNIANTAHIVGLLVGMACGIAGYGMRKLRGR